MHTRPEYLAGVLVVGLLAGCASEDHAPPVVPVSEESCLVCHGGMTGFSPFHNPAAIGCVSCHAGNPADTTETGSHREMIVVPGNLNVARTTCGGESCHPAIVERVEQSLMATGRGIVAVNRWAFGEQPTPNGTDGFADLGNSHADEHLRQLCITCHLGFEKEAPAPVNELSRGGGCVACHVQYHETRNATVHPALTVNISDDHCFGCHSRSGRTSTNYQGWHETLLAPNAVSPDDLNYHLLADGRVFEKKPDDVHHALGLACIDCHTSRETMGDGQKYQHQDAAVEVACIDCHTAETPSTLAWKELDQESRTILLIRYRQELPERRFVKTQKTRQPLINVFLDSTGALVMEGKLTGRRYAPTPPVAACTRPGHERLSCQSCHTEWVAQCQGCHTQRDLDGQWREFASDFFADPPTLGLREDPYTGQARVEPFAPGMIMTLNTHRRALTTEVEVLAEEGTFHRLFAPAVPHTTNAAGRSCESCHNDPLALGFGRGTLILRGDSTAYWTFAPAFASLRDGLPADAWIPFLRTRPDRGTTRLDARPFTRAEQQHILRVGACLTCHPSNPQNDQRLYDDFNHALERMTPACRTIPVDDAMERPPEPQSNASAALQ